MDFNHRESQKNMYANSFSSFALSPMQPNKQVSIQHKDKPTMN
jgi:hypothetical protein